MDRVNEPDGSPLVLVVDDDSMSRLMAGEVLEQEGFRVEEAEDGHLAVLAFDRLHPDLVLMDVMMPTMDGFAACAQIRQKPLGIYTPIVMMTGLDDVESIKQAYQAGATDFITKPINYLLLAYRLRYILRAKQTQDRLRASEAQLANAQRIAKLGHWEWDPEQKRLYCSDEILRILGLSATARFATYSRFLEGVHSEDRHEVEYALKRAVSERKGCSLEYRILRPDGTLRIVHQQAEFSLDEVSGIARLVGTIQDITERKSAEQQIHYLAFYDKVTGLPNRTLLKQHLEQGLRAAKSYGGLAILTIDLDHFTRINDTLGYEAGDKLLQEVARRLSEGLLQRDWEAGQQEQLSRLSPSLEGGSPLLGHFGGDEFVLLTKARGAEEVAQVVQWINNAFERSFVVEGNELCITASIGVSLYPEDGQDAETLLTQSRAALTHAKCQGKNCYMFYTASMNALAYERLCLETSLRKALAQKQFRLYYQPKIELKGARIAGAEALLRWEHPERGLVSPEEFIRVAEETGLIIPLSEWIFREVCQQVVTWQTEGLPPLPVSVNLSAVQFNQKDLPLTLEGVLRETRVDPGSIEIEITESMLMSHIDTAITTLDQIKALGLGIAIDDFGVGYSSLYYLKRFPINALKIDQSFIRDMIADGDETSIKIVSAVVAMAHGLGLKVVAEGVEQESQFRRLRELGCDEVQGYYFSLPLPARAFAKWVQGRHGEVRLRAIRGGLGRMFAQPKA